MEEVGFKMLGKKGMSGFFFIKHAFFVNQKLFDDSVT